MSDNTNLFGVPPTVSARLRATDDATLSRYPDLYSSELKRVIAGFIGVDASNVVTGCGSDDILDSAFRAFVEPGGQIVYPDPSFAMIPLFARMNGLGSTAVSLGADLDIDAERLLASKSRLTYLCSPNNPTGNALSRAAVQRVIDGSQGVVVIDEAYAEFADHSHASTAPATAGLLVSRTFSKAFGLAGLRIGYAVGAPELVAEVEKSRGPYKVSSTAERAAITAMSDDLQWVMDKVAEAREMRTRLAAALQGMGLAPIPSASNFVLVPVSDAPHTATRMRQLGVAVRPFAGLAVVGDALRISVAPWPVLEEVLDALHESLT